MHPGQPNQILCSHCHCTLSGLPGPISITVMPRVHVPVGLQAHLWSLLRRNWCSSTVVTTTSNCTGESLRSAPVSSYSRFTSLLSDDDACGSITFLHAQTSRASPLGQLQYWVKNGDALHAHGTWWTWSITKSKPQNFHYFIKDWLNIFFNGTLSRPKFAHKKTAHHKIPIPTIPQTYRHTITCKH